MIKYKIVLSKKFAKHEKKIPIVYREQIQKIIGMFSLGLWDWLDIKELEPKWNDIYRIRVGKYRIIYKKIDDMFIIIFLDIWSRWDIYK